MTRYIDAEREIKEIEAVLDEKRAIGDDENNIGFYALMQIAGKLRNAPTADVAPVIHAHWIPIKQRIYTIGYSDGAIETVAFACSNCGRSNGIRSNYCPRCGAKMDGGEP